MIAGATATEGSRRSLCAQATHATNMNAAPDARIAGHPRRDGDPRALAITSPWTIALNAKARRRELRAELFHLTRDLRDQALVGRRSHDAIDPVGERLHLRRSHAA